MRRGGAGVFMLWAFRLTFTPARRFAQILRSFTHDTYLHVCAEAHRAKRAECVLSPSGVRFDQGSGRCTRRAHVYPPVPSLRVLRSAPQLGSGRISLPSTHIFLVLIFFHEFFPQPSSRNRESNLSFPKLSNLY